MVEIHKIKMEKEAFDTMVKNLQSFALFIQNREAQKNRIASQNPPVEELQLRVSLLKNRFRNFVTLQKKLGIKEISFDYQTFGKMLENLHPEQKDINTIIENAENTMQKLEDDLNLIGGFINPQKLNNDDVKKYVKNVVSVLGKDTKKQLIENIYKLKQIEK